MKQAPRYTATLAEKLATALSSSLQSFHFREAYSSGRDELVLVFEAQEQVFSCRLLWQAQTCCLFFAREHWAKPSPHYWFFNELKGKAVLAVQAHPGNRSFQVLLENDYLLVFKLYDSLSNVLLLQDEKLLYHFRKNISNDYKFNLEQLKPGKELQSLKASALEEYQPSADVFENITEYSRSYLSAYAFESEKSRLLQYYRQELNRQEAYVNSTSAALQGLAQAVPYEEIGHIIMANLHEIQAGLERVDLYDFYRDATIGIRLKKDMNAQQNAEWYYRKARSRKTEQAELEKRLQQARQKKKFCEDALLRIEEAATLKELRLIEGKTQERKDEKESRELFKQFTYMGFSIWLGKSAANNDLLTFKHSRKNDLWLHARDVSGSHVIIRERPGLSFPMPVIQYAAALAAYYSRAKHSALVPVIYTPRKFVRKPKGAEPGAVLHEKAELILAEPAITI